MIPHAIIPMIRAAQAGLRRALTAAIVGAAFVAATGRARPARAQQPSSASPPPLVFDGVTVVDVERGRLIPAQRVVVVGNRIRAVGGVAIVPVLGGAQVVNATGKYLIPGLWDMHTHPRSYVPVFYPLFVANGVTGIRDAWSDWPTDSLVTWRGEILAGTRVGPPRQLLTGEQPLPETYEDMASRKARGANFLKLYPFSYSKAATARRTGLPFGGHVDPPVTAIEASDSGMNILDHVLSSGDLNLRCLGSRVHSPASIERCRPVAERFKQNNSWWCPTLIRRISFANSSDPTNPGAASDVVRDRLVQVADQFWAGSIPQPHWLHDVVHTGPADSLRFLSIAERVGLPIVAGTDAGAPVRQKEPPGFALHAELAIYVTEGLTPLEALQAATLNPAKLLHGTDSLGTVAAGKLADLVLLDADPLQDITNTTTIRAVVANGRYFDRTALDRLLAGAQAESKTGP